jgi:Fe-S cluster biogenesis protein NfuA
MASQKKNFMVVATEPTPNPAALKFNLNTKAIDNGMRSFNNDIEAEGDPFAETMFSFGVVSALLIQDRFVSVTLVNAEEWELLIDPVIQTIEESLVYYDNAEEAGEKKKTILDEVDLTEFDTFSDPVKAEVIDAYMDENIRPLLAADGGNVLVEEFEDNVLRIRYQGACGSCSKAESGTLVAIQSILQKNLSPDMTVLIQRGNI